MEIRYDPAPGMIGPLVQTDLDPSMPDEMSVQPQPVFAPPKFQFEGLPRKYRAKAVYEIARQRQESADMDADTVIQGTYLEDLRKELSQTRAGREALRRQMEAQTPRMPDAVPQTSLGESLAALLTGLGTGRWNDAAGTAMGSAQAREQRRYAQESQDWQQGQRLAEMDYGAAAEEEDALRRLIQQYQILQEKTRIDRSQAETEQRYRLEQIAAQNEGRVQLADLKTPEGVYRQLAPLVGHDEALKLATASMSLSAAKAEDVPLNRETQNAKAAEDARRNRAKEKLEARSLDIRDYAAKTSHADRQAAVAARLRMFYDGESNDFKKMYANHANRLALKAMGGTIGSADAAAMDKTLAKLKESYRKADVEYQAKQARVSALESISDDPANDPDVRKARLNAVEAMAVRDAIGSDVSQTEDALAGIERTVEVDYSNIFAPKVSGSRRPPPMGGSGFDPLRPDVSGLPQVSKEAKAKAAQKAQPKPNPLLWGLEEALSGKKPPAKPKQGVVKSKSGTVRWKFK